MAASGLFMNWTGAQWDQDGITAAITIASVTDVEINGEVVTEKFFGDNRKFPKQVRNTQYGYTVKLTTGDIKKVLSLPSGPAGTLTIKLNDALNGEGSGCATLVLAACVVGTKTTKGANNKHGLIDVEFIAAGDDSSSPDTDPLTITYAS